MLASSTDGGFLVWTERKEDQQKLLSARKFQSQTEARAEFDFLVDLFQNKNPRIIQNDFYLSEITDADKPAFIEHFKEKEIYNNTLRIPFPYTQEDADSWIEWTTTETKSLGRPINFAIRRRDGYLIGGIGFHGYDLDEPHRAELGYWLAKPYWKNGIMTEAVKSMCHYAFEELGLARLTAHVFHFNFGSARVLEKAGFQLEGYLRNHYSKDGQIFDGKLYAKVPTKSV